MECHGECRIDYNNERPHSSLGYLTPEEFSSQALNRYSYCINNPLKFTDPTGQFFFAIIFAIAAFASSGVVAAAIVGAAIGAGVAAIMGGNVWKAALAGAIGGAFGYWGGQFGVVGATACASGGGALGALATGGDPMMGAMTAGIAAGVSVSFLQSPLPSVFGLGGDEFLDKLILSTAYGALAGGVTAAMFGGDFGQGALYGAAGAAAGFVIYQAINDYVRAIVEDIIYGPLDEIVVWGKGVNENSYREITVKSFRFNEKIGTSYAVSKNEIHTSQDVIEGLRSPNALATRRVPAYDMLRDSQGNYKPGTGYGNRAEQIIAHEIGHTFQAREHGILYLPLVGGLTKFRYTPGLNYFENNASRRGLYGGTVK